MIWSYPGIRSVSQAVQASQELTPTLTLTGADKPAAPSVASLGDGFYSSRYHYWWLLLQQLKEQSRVLSQHCLINLTRWVWTCWDPQQQQEGWWLWLMIHDQDNDVRRTTENGPSQGKIVKKIIFFHSNFGNKNKITGWLIFLIFTWQTILVFL